jgi:hypothetical protein
MHNNYDNYPLLVNHSNEDLFDTDERIDKELNLINVFFEVLFIKT